MLVEKLTILTINAGKLQSGCCKDKHQINRLFEAMNILPKQDLVVQKVESANQRINHYPAYAYKR